MSREHGKLQPVKGAFLRTYDSVKKFLGLTGGTPLQIKLNKLAYLLFGFAIILAIIVFGVNKFNVTNEVAVYAISTGMLRSIKLIRSVLTTLQVLPLFPNLLLQFSRSRLLLV
jgi:Na+-exporting ATPase